MREMVETTGAVANRKLVLYLIGAFAVISSLMAGIGLMNLMVSQRSKEIAIRIALGVCGMLLPGAVDGPGTSRRTFQVGNSPGNARRNGLRIGHREEWAEVT
jgi:hypothetical protein